MWSGLIRGPAWQSLLWIWGAATVTAHDAPYLDRLKALLSNSGRLLRWLLARIPGVVKSRFVHKSSSRLDDKEGVPFKPTVTNQFLRSAGKSFHPRPLDASGVLIRAEFPGEEILPGYDFTNGWRGLFARGLEIVQATGDHVSMVADENAATFRRQINAVLDRYDDDKEEEGRRVAGRNAVRG